MKVKQGKNRTQLYENPATYEYATLSDYTGSGLNPRRFKNRVSVTNKETARSLVNLLLDKTNIKIVSRN